MTKGKFLKGELKERGGARARAKKFAIPQREKNVGEMSVDEETREVRYSYL